MGEPIHPELVVIGTYPDELNANLAKTALEAAGIESMIRNDMIANLEHRAHAEF
jgi:hypothetical protein